MKGFHSIHYRLGSDVTLSRHPMHRRVSVDRGERSLCATNACMQKFSQRMKCRACPLCQAFASEVVGWRLSKRFASSSGSEAHSFGSLTQTILNKEGKMQQRKT